MTKKVIIILLASPVSLVNVANAEEKSQNEEVKYSKELVSHCEIVQIEKFIKYIYQCKDMGETFSRNLYQNSDLKMSIGVSEPTTVSELVQIKYDKLSHEILGFYTPLNYYDEEVRETNNFTIN